MPVAQLGEGSLDPPDVGVEDAGLVGDRAREARNLLGADGRAKDGREGEREQRGEDGVAADGRAPVRTMGAPPS
jgi:hypothetical protein